MSGGDNPGGTRSSEPSPAKKSKLMNWLKNKASYLVAAFRVRVLDRLKSKVSYLVAALIYLLPLLILPNFVMLFAYAILELEGSVTQLTEILQAQDLQETMMLIWWPYVKGNHDIWVFIGAFFLFELILMYILPGHRYGGKMTCTGNVMHYKNNGLMSFVITMSAFNGLVYYEVIDPLIIYDNFMYLMGALNVVAVALSCLLFIKGKVYPTTTDVTTTGNFIVDFYKGIELHPKILYCDVKLFIHSRFAMMGWALLLLAFIHKQYALFGVYSDSMIIGIVLQIVYITKFFFWEQGYVRSLDITDTRVGFSTCWGNIVWMPCIYTSQTMYLVTHPNNLGVPLVTALIVAGLWSIYINYEADNQKEDVRKNAQSKIWRRDVQVIKANYKIKDGSEMDTVLLVSGWWGVSRHFHYIPEILAALCWSIPVLFSTLLPHFYVMYLVVLLVSRARRVENRCQEKYGSGWEEYCKRVPNKLIPGIY